MRDQAKPVVVLFLICFVITLLLAVTYNFTKDIIAARAESDLEAAKLVVLPAAKEFRRIENVDDMLPEGFATDTVNGAFEGYDGDTLKGYVISIIEKGYGGDINLIVGIGSDGTVTGLKIGDNNETPGLGKKVEAPKFYEQLVGIKPEENLVVVKMPGSKDEEIEAVSGATVSSKAIVRGVQTAVNMGKAFRGEDVDETGGATTDGTGGATGGSN